LEVSLIILTKRQEQILSIVHKKGPITGDEIAESLGLTRATLRPDFTFLTRTGILGAKPRVGYYYDGTGMPDRMTHLLTSFIVQDWMGIPIIISGALSVYDAIVEIFMRDVGSLFITDENGALSGIVSRKDLLKVSISQGEIRSIPISMIMTRMPNLITCFPEETLLSAAQKLQDHQIDCLPVVRRLDGNPGSPLEVVGRITKTTIVKAFVKLGS
jgi:CBS domain-containing protein